MFSELMTTSFVLYTMLSMSMAIETNRNFIPLAFDERFPIATYPVDFDLVSETEAVASDSPELGPCICDLTFARCDINCYCDTSDCSAAEIALFSSRLPEGPKVTHIRKCVDRDLVEANARGELTYTIVENLLCVEKINNPKTGDYFTDPGVITAAIFNEQRARLPYSFQNAALLTSSASSAVYKAGSLILAARTSGSGLVSTQHGWMTLPKAGETSDCEDGNFAKFLEGQESKCYRRFEDLQTQCLRHFDSSSFTTQLKIGKVPLSSPDTPSGYVDVSLASIQFEHPAFGNLSTLTSLPTTSFDSVSCVCSNALTQVEYDIAYSSSGEISAVSASVRLGNVSCNGGVEQTFTTKFSRDFVSVDKSRAKSGNPGYVQGLPILSGTLLTNNGKTAVSQDVSGLLVSGAGPDGLCTNVNGSGVSLTFGEDMLSTCLISLTSAQLEQRCRSGGVLEFLSLPSTVVGKWGNSDFLSASDWVAIDKTEPSTSYDWSESKQSCTGIVDSLNIEFLTVDLGSISNPQRKIIAARARYLTTTWSKSILESTSKFEVRITTTFVLVPASGVEEVLPPARPFLPRLPYDVLYPLLINSAPSFTQPSATTLVVLLLSLFILHV